MSEPKFTVDEISAAAEERADALLAISAHAAAAMQLERLERGAKRIGYAQAAAVADAIGEEIVLSLAQAACSEKPAKLRAIASSHWRAAREKLALCRLERAEGAGDAGD